MRIILRAFRIVLDLFAWILCRLFSSPQKGKVPPIIDRLLLQSAHDLSLQIKSGKLKSEVLVKTYIDRIKTVQPFINAIVDQRFAEAVLEAIEIDKRVEHELNGNDSLIPNLSIKDQPLLGIPLSIKDSIAVESMAFDGGLESRKGVKSKKDSKVVKLLRESGAIPIVITNVAEMTYWWNTSNKIYGQTNNPYDLSLMPGGSSGGEAALISSAASIIGIGSDLGGSIRIPSFFCGIFGHKPTPGLVSAETQFPAMTPEKIPFLSIGPMTRYATDLLPMFKVMIGPNISKLKKERVELSKVKIYYMYENGNPFDTSVTSDIKHSIDKIVAHMTQTYGNYTKKVYFEQMSESFPILLYSFEQAKLPSFEQELHCNIYHELIKFIFNRSNHTLNVLLMTALPKFLPNLNSDFGQKCLRLCRELKQELEQLLGNDGILLYPTHPEPAPKHISEKFKVTNISYTCIFNALGFPVTQCPIGLNSDGLPLGIQVVGTPFNDLLILQMAQTLEKAFGGWVSPSNIVC